MMEINPDLPEAHNLRGWYDGGGSNQTFYAQTTASFQGGPTTFDRRDIQLLNDVREAELGMGENAEYFSTRATIMHIKSDNIAYPACQTQGCSKKVIEQHDGWRCEKCDRSWEKPSYRYSINLSVRSDPILMSDCRYVMSMAVADHSGQAWLQGFNDVGQAVFNVSADELVGIKVSHRSSSV